MLQVKIFQDHNDHDLALEPPIEASINKWLASEQSIQVHNVLQSSWGTEDNSGVMHSYTTITFLYATS